MSCYSQCAIDQQYTGNGRECCCALTHIDQGRIMHAQFSWAVASQLITIKASGLWSDSESGIVVTHK